ncbi:MAG: galactose-1-phosphate uridylyltransferase [Myxococcales bacterium]|nr:galactose-1-phosphate uridylyltransferase [Myxococcota bacterium]MDW8282798.1 galactose-1-phosphate uridylyltransferase [Myxococcales bacterium]
MRELRRDPLTGHWVALAPDQTPNRSAVALAAQDPLLLRSPSSCPLCPGAEIHTPPEVYAHRPPVGPASQRDAPGWSLRVVPHRYPALGIEGDMGRRSEGFYDRMNGIGAHEVLVETPDHRRGLHDQSEPEVEQVLWALRHRILDLRRDSRFRHIVVSRAHGQQAGATLSHPHTELFALPVVPRPVRERVDSARRHHEERDRCLLCDIVDHETAAQRRLVYENSSFVVICPYASRTPFETWVVPRRHRPRFEESPSEEMPALASALRMALRRLWAALGGPCYRLVLHNAPFVDRLVDYVHFSIEIVPQVGPGCSVDQSGGLHINPTPPEEAARYLRQLRELPESLPQ